MDTDLARPIMAQVETRFYLPDGHAKSQTFAEHYRRAGLTPHQLWQLPRSPRRSGTTCTRPRTARRGCCGCRSRATRSRSAAPAPCTTRSGRGSCWRRASSAASVHPGVARRRPGSGGRGAAPRARGGRVGAGDDGAWRPTVVDGGLAPPSGVPALRASLPARRAWKVVVVDRLEDLGGAGVRGLAGRDRGGRRAGPARPPARAREAAGRRRGPDAGRHRPARPDRAGRADGGGARARREERREARHPVGGRGAGVARRSLSGRRRRRRSPTATSSRRSWSSCRPTSARCWWR